MIEYEVHQRTPEDCPTVKKFIGWFQVTARDTESKHVGWAVQKTEAEAKNKARLRLEYSRDYL